MAGCISYSPWKIGKSSNIDLSYFSQRSSITIFYIYSACHHILHRIYIRFHKKIHSLLVDFKSVTENNFWQKNFATVDPSTVGQFLTRLKASGLLISSKSILSFLLQFSLLSAGISQDGSAQKWKQFSLGNAGLRSRRNITVRKNFRQSSGTSTKFERFKFSDALWASSLRREYFASFRLVHVLRNVRVAWKERKKIILDPPTVFGFTSQLWVLTKKGKGRKKDARALRNLWLRNCDVVSI